MQAGKTSSEGGGVQGEISGSLNGINNRSVASSMFEPASAQAKRVFWTNVAHDRFSPYKRLNIRRQ